jgi:hypothetical protein
MGGEEPSQKLLCEAAAFKNVIARSHPKNVFARVSRSCEPKEWQPAGDEAIYSPRTDCHGRCGGLAMTFLGLSFYNRDIC